MPRIAFDLDNTLLRSDFEFPEEEPTFPFLAGIMGSEKLRKGTKDLFVYCLKKDWNVWIYTSSYRSQLKIRLLFWLYGIKLNGIVNQYRHDNQVKQKSVKYPPAFGIDILVDDSEYIFQEGKRLGYCVILVKPDDDRWVDVVKQNIKEKL